MRPRLSPLLLALALLAGGAFAGCIRPQSDDEPAPDVNASATDRTEPDATLPDGRGESAGIKEVNKTEEGVGGMDHKHDYWKGETRIVVYEGDPFFNVFPVYPDGEGSNAASVAYIKLPPPMLVYEGTVSVEVLVNSVDLLVDDGTVSGQRLAAAHPAAPSLKLSYRTAASEDFLEGPALAIGTPAALSVSSKETDMPHSVSSLWAFRIATDKPEWLASANLTITIVKGGNVVDWPGHPDFYAEKSERVVLDADLSVHRQGIEEGILYGSASSWVHPEKLISYGTGYVDVFVNVTSATSSNGAEPTGFFLEYHDATILDAEDAYNDRIDDEAKGRQFDHQDYHFVVPVTAEGMDGPYQPSSRWGFRVVATFAETPAASLCPGCFAYDIQFHMTIIAHKGEDAARING